MSACAVPRPTAEMVWFISGALVATAYYRHSESTPI
jgi:hypothetical protein